MLMAQLTDVFNIMISNPSKIDYKSKFFIYLEENYIAL